MFRTNIQIIINQPRLPLRITDADVVYGNSASSHTQVCGSKVRVPVCNVRKQIATSSRRSDRDLVQSRPLHRNSVREEKTKEQGPEQSDGRTYLREMIERTGGLVRYRSRARTILCSLSSSSSISSSQLI
jgi:hypothetical protein